MRETCFCGRGGELEDREPVLDTRGYWLLRCPTCGHLDDLEWLTEEAALLLWGEARRRREDALEAA
jgi:diadenosine tetraphosphatase ApaH/serine/threonine PP2A family protein phosphatase